MSAHVQKHVLFVDDEPMSRRTVERILRTGIEGVRVTCAGDGAQALDVLDREAVDLLITDLTMPVIDGIELLLQVAHRRLLIPLLVVTGHPSPATETLVLSAGAIECFEKPIMADAFLRCVRELLFDGQQRAQLELVSLPCIIRLIDSGRKTCALRVTAAGAQGVLIFSAGDLVDARQGALSGEPAARAILGWSDASITLDPQVHARARTVFTDITELLGPTSRREPRTSGHPGPARSAAPAQVVRARARVDAGPRVALETPPEYSVSTSLPPELRAPISMPAPMPAPAATRAPVPATDPSAPPPAAPRAPVPATDPSAPPPATVVSPAARSSAPRLLTPRPQPLQGPPPPVPPPPRMSGPPSQPPRPSAPRSTSASAPTRELSPAAATPPGATPPLPNIDPEPVGPGTAPAVAAADTSAAAEAEISAGDTAAAIDPALESTDYYELIDRAHDLLRVAEFAAAERLLRRALEVRPGDRVVQQNLRVLARRRATHPESNHGRGEAARTENHGKQSFRTDQQAPEDPLHDHARHRGDRGHR